MKKLLVIVSLFVTGYGYTSLDPDFIQMPSAEDIKLSLSNMGLEDFDRVVDLSKKLGDKEMTPLGLAYKYTLSVNEYCCSLRNSSLSEEDRTKKIKNIRSKKTPFMQEMLKDYVMRYQRYLTSTK